MRQDDIAQALDLGHIADIGHLGDRLRPLPLQLRAERLQARTIDIGQHQLHAQPCRMLGQAPANTAGCAGNHRHPPLLVAHFALPLLA
ncbi:hypothetical protein D3C85_1150460 [compost metagenome]